MKNVCVPALSTNLADAQIWIEIDCMRQFCVFFIFDFEMNDKNCIRASLIRRTISANWTDVSK